MHTIGQQDRWYGNPNMPATFGLGNLDTLQDLIPVPGFKLGCGIS